MKRPASSNSRPQDRPAQKKHRRPTAQVRARQNSLALSKERLQQEIVYRKAAQEALRQSEQHYRKLLKHSGLMQQHLRLLSHQLLSAQEQERKKISRELHDVIAQTLTGINLRLATLKRDASISTRGLGKNIARTQRLVEKSVTMVQQFARELRPTVLDDLGLIPALHAFMKKFIEQTGIRVSLSVFAEVEKVNGEKRTILYRVAQEALNNVARHARASQAEVKIQKLDNSISMKVTDNGKGFVAKRMSGVKKRKRLGLLGMRERLEMVGGTIQITSATSQGTTIQAQIPLAEPPLSTARKSAPRTS